MEEIENRKMKMGKIILSIALCKNRYFEKKSFKFDT